MSIERVKNYFKGYGMEERIQEFDVSSATVELAAAALDCEPQRIAKSLSFLVMKNPGLTPMPQFYAAQIPIKIPYLGHPEVRGKH